MPEPVMMRLTMAVWWSLALVWLLTSQAGAEPNLAKAARRVEVIGYGPTLEAAKKNALAAATSKVLAQLGKQHLTHWQPTPEFVSAHLLEGPGRAGSEELFEGLPTKSWIHAVHLPDDADLRALDRQAERRERAEERMGLGLRGLTAILVVLVVLVSVVRLDEWTDSRYTTWLRLGGAMLLAGLAVGWWSTH
jgi:hypothetical protein